MCEYINTKQAAEILTAELGQNVSYWRAYLASGRTAGGAAKVRYVKNFLNGRIEYLDGDIRAFAASCKARIAKALNPHAHKPAVNFPAFGTVVFRKVV